MSFPPTPLVPHQLATSSYLNNAFSGANTAITTAQSAANTANTSISAASATPVAGALVKYDATTKAITLQPGTLSRNTAKEMGVWASAPISTVVNYGAAAFMDKTATNPTPRYLAAGTTSHSVPAAGLERWDIVSVAPGTAGVTVKTGPTATIGTNPSYPPVTLTITATTDVALYAVYTKAGMTGITDVSDGTNGFIVPLLALNLGGGGAGGTGTGLSTSDIVWIWGGAADDPSAMDPYVLLSSQPTAAAGMGLVNGHDKANLSVSFQRVRGGDPAVLTSTPDLGQTLLNWHGGMEQRPQDFIFIGSNSTVTVNNTVQVFSADNVPRQLLAGTSGQVLTASPPASQYSTWFLVADCTGRTDGCYVVTLSQVAPVLNGYRKTLARLLNNGSFFFGPPFWDMSTLQTVSGPQIVPLRQSYSGVMSQTIGAASVTTPPTKVTGAEKVLAFPCNMQIDVVGKVQVYAAAANTQGQAQFAIDGIPLGQPSSFGLGLAAGYVAEVPLLGSYGDAASPTVFLGSGGHTLDVLVNPLANGGILIVQEVTWLSTQSGVLS